MYTIKSVSLNYLGHAVLSENFGEKLMGNLIGDYVKGRIEHSTYSEDINKGLLLHRKIDEFTDRHPACLRAKTLFRIDYKLYSGPIVDVIWDYFLANDPSFFTSELALREFSHIIYSKIETNFELIPTSAHPLFQHMIQEDWLYDVRHLRGLRAALNRLMYRFNNDMTADKAFETVMRHYYELNQMYLEFIDDIKESLKFD